MKKTFFYGWLVAIASGLGIASGIAIFIGSTIGILVGPITADLGWTAKEFFVAPLCATVSTILIAPFIGGIIDRFSVRKVIIFSFLAEALIMASFHYLDSNLLGLYVRYAAFAIFATGTTHVTFCPVVARWFDKRRGLALGITLAGIGIGGMFWTFFVPALISAFGWRDAYLYMAGFVAFISLPIVLLIVRETPQSMGLHVDGDASSPVMTAAEKKASLTGMTWKEAAHTRQYWVMIATFLLLGFGLQGITLQLVPFLKSQGASEEVWKPIVASTWGVLIVGRLLSGWLLDRFFAPRVAFCFILLPIFAIGMLAAGASGGYALLAAMMVGLAMGAEIDVVAYLTARYFGLKHYAAIYATYFSAYTLGSGLGPLWIAKRLEDTHGNYSPVLWGIVGVLSVGAVLLLTYQRYPQHEKSA